jgi:hypothetical protein
MQYKPTALFACALSTHHSPPNCQSCQPVLWQGTGAQWCSDVLESDKVRLVMSSTCCLYEAAHVSDAGHPTCSCVSAHVEGALALWSCEHALGLERRQEPHTDTPGWGPPTH